MLKSLASYNNSKVIFKSQGIKRSKANSKEPKPALTKVGKGREGELNPLPVRGEVGRKAHGPSSQVRNTGPSCPRKGYPPAQARVKKRQGEAGHKLKFRVTGLQQNSKKIKQTEKEGGGLHEKGCGSEVFRLFCLYFITSFTQDQLSNSQK